MPVSNEFAFTPVHELIGFLEKGGVTSSALVEMYLARIEQYDPTLGAFVASYAEDAMSAARTADHMIASGRRIGPLQGVPIVIKDLIDISGRVTTGGSKIWENRISPITAPLVRRLISAGMIVLGKSRTVEFALGGYGTNHYMGTPLNPWDLTSSRAPGGSSSGTAVAVAAALSPWGIGTDTGGSVRIPSAWCGLTGLKTTIGQISNVGVLPLAETFDTVGPICRNVDDCALLYNALRGDALNGIHIQEHILRNNCQAFSDLVLAKLPSVEREGINQEVLSAYDESIQMLEHMGARVIDISFPHSLSHIGDLVTRIICIEAYSHVGAFAADASLPIDPDVRPRVLSGEKALASEYLGLLRERELAKIKWNAIMNGVDAVLTPTMARPAPVLADIDQSEVATPFTRFVNYLDWCALSLPNGFTGDGLPISLQIACPSNQEALALRIGRELQNASDWHQRTPQLPS